MAEAAAPWSSRRRGHAGFARGAGGVSCLAAGAGPPGLGEVVRLNPLAWLGRAAGRGPHRGRAVELPAARAMRMLRWAPVLAPLASVAAALVGGPAAADDGDVAAVLPGLDGISILAAGGSALALRFSALSARRFRSQHAAGGVVAPRPAAPLGTAARVAVQLAAAVGVCGVIWVGLAAGGNTDRGTGCAGGHRGGLRRMACRGAIAGGTGRGVTVAGPDRHRGHSRRLWPAAAEAEHESAAVAVRCGACTALPAAVAGNCCHARSLWCDT
jgi:hypothetical protein